MSFDIRVNCPMCGAEHIIDEWDHIYDEEDENYRDDPHICWKCYTEREEMQIISDVSGILDMLDENGKEHFAKLLCGVLESDKSRNLYAKIVDKHFMGYDGMIAWGEW